MCQICLIQSKLNHQLTSLVQNPKDRNLPLNSQSLSQWGTLIRKLDLTEPK